MSSALPAATLPAPAASTMSTRETRSARASASATAPPSSPAPMTLTVLMIRWSILVARAPSSLVPLETLTGVRISRGQGFSLTDYAARAASDPTMTNSPNLTLADKVAVITGGSRGIGLAVAKRLQQQGAAVVVTGTTQSRLDAAARELDGGPALAL